jgi:phospholipid transport system substrate-binding protein
MLPLPLCLIARVHLPSFRRPDLALSAYPFDPNGNFDMMRSTIKNSGNVFAAVFAISLGLWAMSPRATATADEGAGAVQSLYSTLLTAMRNGPSLGARGRYAEIEPVVRRVFDVPLMTRVAIGSQWGTLSEPQQQQAIEAFTHYIAAIYAERFDSYSGEQLQVTGQQPSPGGAIITSRIVKSDGEPVAINYLMRDNGGVWQIADVYFDGTISELATRRSEFEDILRRSGFDGLIQALNDKAAALAS